MSILYLVTPLLGSLKNYIKYKQFKIHLFIRTPFIYFFFSLILKEKHLWKILIYERWFLFVFKTILSIYRDDYNIKKDKYIKKYGLKY